jgi:hypothetical protein
MSLFTFFNNHKREPEVSDAELDAALEEVQKDAENVSTKPLIKPQRLATIIETQEVEHFEQPPQDDNENIHD